VGPSGAAVAGVDSTPDGRTLFVNIKHPGKSTGTLDIISHWPTTQATGADPTGARPRSATIVIERTDGGIVGL
ncbi:hypothetical protein, partial [Sphingomonas sp.]|uniref:hypothetical protein n=1 Tax=Sphingomonas sp. TaxID=28214 RepID=UPI002C0D5C53